MRGDIYQLKSAMRKNVFSFHIVKQERSCLTRYQKIQQYLSFSYLNEEIDCDRKYEGQKNAYWTQIFFSGIEECEYAVHF